MEGIFEKNDLKFLIRQIKDFWGYAPMFHSHVEVIYVISGCIPMTISGRKHTLSAGELSIAFPYAVHSYTSAPDAEAIILMFDPSVAGPFEKKLLSRWPRVPYVTDGGSIAMLLQKLLHCAKVEGEDARELAMAYLQVVIGEVLLALDLVGTEGTDISTIQKILIYCSQHYTEDITLKMISQSIYVSQSAITKTFSNKLGCSFRDYINRLRISKAKYELENTDRKITDIMNDCGFQNQSSFNRVFLQITGTSPSQCRKPRNSDLE